MQCGDGVAHVKPNGASNVHSGADPRSRLGLARSAFASRNPETSTQHTKHRRSTNTGNARSAYRPLE